MSESDYGEIVKWLIYLAVWVSITYRMMKAKKS